MRHLTYKVDPLGTYPLAVLVTDIRGEEIRKAYLEPYDIDPDLVMVLDLHQSREKKKTPVIEIREYLTEELIPVLENAGVEYVVCSDGDYFKALTGAAKAEPFIGYVMKCALHNPAEPDRQMQVVYVPNFKQIFYDPEKVNQKIRRSITAIANHQAGIYEHPGHEVIQFEAYPETDEEIEEWLCKLLDMGRPLTIDIEGFDLKHTKSGLGSISFAWSKHEGIAFAVDYIETSWFDADGVEHYGKQSRNVHRRMLLAAFFEQFAQKAIYHNISFDVYILIYQLFMKDILDTEGLLHGMDVLLANWDCTKLIAFLATNTCAGNELGLKVLSQEYAGNYSMGDDIKDITRIPLKRLLRYNLIDALSTWHVHEKHVPTMVCDNQEDFYRGIFQPAVRDVIQMQLTGLPVNMRKVKIAKYLLERDEREALRTIRASPLVTQFTQILRQNWIDKKNLEWKKKRGTIADVPDTVIFNPNSGPQLQILLYEMLALPVIDFTDSKQPATGGKTLAKLVHHATNQLTKDFILALIDYGKVVKILSDFIPSLLDSALGPDGWHYLFGNFNLGGTQSARLSSSDPNLQNLPANSKYAKLIKWCIEAPPGWIYVGLDFSSLEDRISALTTKDPNKIKVYTDGYDGHSLRAQAYFADQMPDIDPNDVASINSVAIKYKKQRQDSKVPTFALTYMGTWSTLVKNAGLPEALAREIERRYHELYVVSDQWVEAKLAQASLDGYVTCAFGLRLRTPLLSQVIRGNKRTPKEAEAEGRSAGNALGQSWCLLNTRAGSEFMGKVRSSVHRMDIKPCAQIHDAQYYLVREDLAALAYTNEHLVEAVNWQNHPDIAHPDVGLGGEMSIFWPTWRDEIGIENGLGEDGIADAIQAALAKRNSKKEPHA